MVTISGMFGDGHTYFADSPVVIKVEGLEWPDEAPVTMVMVDVIYLENTVGRFRIDAVGQSSVTLDISSALRAMWSSNNYADAPSAANAVARGESQFHSFVNYYRQYSLVVTTEYISPQDSEITTTSTGEIAGGSCLPGHLTEWERSLITDPSEADVSWLNGTNLRFGDASTKPLSSPERIGRDSITSWLDFDYERAGLGRVFCMTIFMSSDTDAAPDSQSVHAPLVLRDTVPYVDFLFINRRGGVETCSAIMAESMSMDAENKEYAHPDAVSFVPSRSLQDIASGGRRSWSMSSGHQTREWLEWWVSEFLLARQRWMLYTYERFDATQQRRVTERTFVPVTVKSAKKNNTIYDHAKQQMESVEFTVTLALEG